MIPYASGLPEDVISNTLYFDYIGGLDVEDAVVAQTANIAEAYDDFYSTMLWASYVDQGNAEVRWYLMASPPPRIPIIVPLGLTNVSSSETVIPAEVSVVLSFHGSPLAGEPAARRRGRIYLGGCGNPTAQATLSSPPRVASAVNDDVRNGASQLLTDSATLLMPWVVWSPTNASFTEVVAGWTDNEPDTQRRRGVGATLRTTWP